MGVHGKERSRDGRRKREARFAADARTRGGYGAHQWSVAGQEFAAQADFGDPGTGSTRCRALGTLAPGKRGEMARQNPRAARSRTRRRDANAPGRASLDSPWGFGEVGQQDKPEPAHRSAFAHRGAAKRALDGP